MTGDALMDLSLDAVSALNEACVLASAEVGATTKVEARRRAAESLREHRERRWRSITWHGRKAAAVVEATGEEAGGSFEWPLGGLLAAGQRAASRDDLTASAPSAQVGEG